MNTGLRRGEVLELNWVSVDFTRRLLTVEGGTPRAARTRHVPLNDEATSVLRRYREQSGNSGRVFDAITEFGRHGERLGTDVAPLRGFSTGPAT